MAASLDRVPEKTPRRVRPSAYLMSGGGGLLMLGAFWLAVGAGATAGLGSSPAAWDDLILTLRGRTVKGRALAVVPTESLLRGAPLGEIRFVFRDAKGRLQTGRSRTGDEALLRRARGGGEVTVRYDRFDPARARIQNTRLSPFGIFIAIPLLLAAAGAAAFVLGLLRSLGRRAVLVHGVRAAGRVLDVSVSESPLRGRRSYDVRYAFDGPGGELQGISAETEGPRAGTEVVVLYDPVRPWRSLLAPEDAFRP
jgi:uncharacterized protein DUF3592